MASQKVAELTYLSCGLEIISWHIHLQLTPSFYFWMTIQVTISLVLFMLQQLLSFTCHLT